MKLTIIYDLFDYWIAKLGSDSHFDTNLMKFQKKIRHFKV